MPPCTQQSRDTIRCMVVLFSALLGHCGRGVCAHPLRFTVQSSFNEP